MKNLFHFPIKVNLESTGIPSYFILNGRYYRIQKIERKWETIYKALGERGYKVYLRVKAEDGNYYEIAYDSLLDMWFLERMDVKSSVLIL